MTTANVVFSGSATNVDPLAEERTIASGQTILPGHLVLENGSNEWVVSTVDGDGHNYRIADMNYIEAKSVTEALTAGDTAKAFVPTPGDYFNVVLTTSQTIAKGDPITSNGDGTVKEASPATEAVLAYADEAVTTTGATGRLRVRIATAGANYKVTA